MSRYLPFPKSALIAFLLLLSLVMAAGCAPAAQEGGDEEEVAQTEDAIDTGARIEFEQPEDGSEVAGPDVTAEVEIEGFVLSESVGQDPVEGEGHIHWIVDGGEPIVSTADSITASGLAAGEHTIVAELHQNNHAPLDPEVTADVRFTVGDGKGPTPGAGVRDDDNDNGDDRDRDNSGPGGGGDDKDTTSTTNGDDETTSTTAMEDETTSTTIP